MCMKELQSNEFWKKKMWAAMKVRDTDGDGFITSSDFKLVVQRYKDMGASEEHLGKLQKGFAEMYKASGIADDSTVLTYDQFATNFAKAIESGLEFTKVYTTQFEIIDSDGNGEISFKEWVDYYKALGIDTAQAKASFNAMDTNGDSIVSKEEFVAFNEEFYFTVENKLKSSILYGPLD